MNQKSCNEMSMVGVDTSRWWQQSTDSLVAIICNCTFSLGVSTPKSPLPLAGQGPNTMFTRHHKCTSKMASKSECDRQTDRRTDKTDRQTDRQRQRDRQTDHATEKCVGIGGIACTARAFLLNNYNVEYCRRLSTRRHSDDWKLTWPQRVDLRVGLVAIARSRVMQCSTVALVQP